MRNDQMRVLRERVLYLVVSAAPPAQAIGELVTLLQGQNWKICVIPTPTAAGWLDATALAEQTSYPVRSEPRHPYDPDPLPRADAICVVPATFNTINKWAAGISDTFALSILNEAIGLELPIYVVPYAKSTLAKHPAFGESLTKLAGWGVTMLPNEVVRTPDRQTFDWVPVVDALVKGG